jgi:transcriptional regulator with XRE-family HTH domain
MPTAHEAVSNKRTAESTDFEIGRRIRALRLERGLSQTKLGTLVGVTFQQIQKYEKGTNRVASGRLQRLSNALNVPITFFYADTAADAPNPNADSVDVGLEFLKTAGAVRLARAFARIKDPEMRRTLVEIAEGIAGPEATSQAASV